MSGTIDPNTPLLVTLAWVLCNGMHCWDLAQLCLPEDVSAADKNSLTNAIQRAIETWCVSRQRERIAANDTN